MKIRVSKTNKYYIVAVTIFLVFGFFSGRKFIEDSKERDIARQEKYRLITYSESVSGTISSISRGGFSDIVLQDSSYVTLKPAMNYNYELFALHCFLQRHDSIVKCSNSDTLYIYRNHKVYYFIFNESIDGEYNTRFIRNPC